MFEVLVGIQIVTIILILYSLIYMFRGGSTYAQKLMMAFMIAELVHNAGYLLELQARTLQEAMIAVKVEYMGGSIVAIFFMMFILNYCGHKEYILFERGMLLCGCAVILMVWTSPWHSLYYKTAEFVESGLYPHLLLTYGPGFYFYFVTCTIIPWAICLFVLLTSIRKEQNAKRRGKLRFIIIGSSCMALVLLLYVLRVFPEGYDPTPAAMGVMLFTLVVFVWNRKDFDLTRMAANTVLNSLGDCMITLDENKKVLIYNDAAKNMYPDITLYQYIDQVKSFPQHIFQGEACYRFERGDKHYEGHVRTLEDLEHIVRGYTILITDVTSIHEHIREVNEMREKAEEANRAKSDFLANMSHEIRTPMNAVVGTSELIIEESRGRKMYDYACNIKSAALNLLSIINDILDISKVEAGKMELVESEYYVQVLVNDTVNLVQMAAAQRGLKMRVNMDEDIPHQLWGDVGRIRQVLINILNNAIKFTRKGCVSLSVSSEYVDEDNINLRFIIEDTGIGIKEEDLASIFESFQQLDMSKNRMTEGTGLGLPITKSLVTLMQGDIQVESEYGKGTKFIIDIKQQVKDHKTIGEMPMTKMSKDNSELQMFQSREYKVLVVDDNIINRKVATAMLDSYAFQLHEASSGQAAIDLVDENDYDIIFMDHMMPEMDGIEATRAIRKNLEGKRKQPVIIALTANAIQGAREMYLENGFEDFLSKPFERVQMHEILDKWVLKDQREYVNELVEEEKVSEDEMADIYMFGVNVLDVVRGKDYSMNEYLNLLQQFRQDSVDKVPLLCKLAQERQYYAYGEEMGKLKKLAAGIGAGNLSLDAQEQQEAVQAGDYDLIDRQYAHFVMNYERIVSEIGRVLHRKESNLAKNVKSE